MSYDQSFQNNMIEGISKFQSARMGAFWEEMSALIRGRTAELMSFEDIRSRLRLSEESYRGLHDIEIDKIAGSVGRYKDFTSSFLPRRGKMQERWSRIYAHANSMAGLPPIEVYKVADVYFVRDGNHRVSVARQLKAETIQAHVTELRTPIALHPKMSPEALDQATAYANFLAETELRQTRPHHQSLELTEPSRYGELMHHIYLHQRMLEEIEKREVLLREAAAHWYDEVYRPAVTLIRKHEVMESVSSNRGEKMRTEADLYIWLISHLSAVQQEFGDSRSTTYSDALVDFLSEKRIAVPKDLLNEDDATVPITQTRLMWALHRQDDDSPRAFSGENPYVRRQHTA